MKVKIKDLEPNPFRDMKNYPFNQEKLETLRNSIKDTGFWDNILARKSNGKLEIAYGHHRLKILQGELKLDDIIDIPVKPLTDAMMIKIMANENMVEWKTSVAVIDETIRTTKEFLESHPEELKKLGYPRREKISSGEPKFRAGADLIARFLNWSPAKVGFSIERLGLIEEGRLDKEAVESMPTEYTARKFVSAVKKTGLKDKESQKKVAERIVKEENFSEEGIRSEVFEEKYKIEEKAEDKEQIKKQEFEFHLRQITKKADSLYHDLIDLLEYKEFLLSNHYQKSREGQNFVYSVARLFDTFRTLIAAEERRSDLIESFKLLIESKK